MREVLLGDSESVKEVLLGDSEGLGWRSCWEILREWRRRSWWKSLEGV